MKQVDAAANDDLNTCSSNDSNVLSQLGKRKRLVTSEEEPRAKVKATDARRKLTYELKEGVEKTSINKFDVIIKEICELRRDHTTLRDEMRKEMTELRRDQNNLVTGIINHLTTFNKSIGIIYVLVIRACCTPQCGLHKY